MAALVIAEHDNTAVKGATLNTVTAALQCGGDVHVRVGIHAAGNCASLYDGHCHLFSLVEEVARTRWPSDPVNPGLFPGQADQTGTPVGA